METETKVKDETTKQIQNSPKPPHPFISLCAERAQIVIQQKGGILIRGKMKRLNSGILSLTDATIKGQNHEVTVPWVLIDHQSIAHLHPEVNGDKAKDETL